MRKLVWGGGGVRTSTSGHEFILTLYKILVLFRLAEARHTVGEKTTGDAVARIWPAAVTP